MTDNKKLQQTDRADIGKAYSEMNENVKAGQIMIHKDIYFYIHSQIKKEKESSSIKLLSINYNFYLHFYWSKYYILILVANLIYCQIIVSNNTY